MNARIHCALATVLLLSGSRAAAAQSLTRSLANAGPYHITTAVAGQNPTTVSGGAGTYTVTTKKNAGQTRITAQLSTALPAGTTLTITLASPGGTAQSVGPVSLTTTAQSVVINLPASNTTYPAAAISYQFSATPSAGVVSSRSVNVIFALAP